MARDVTGHDATTDLSESFTAGLCSRIVVTIKWTGIVGSTAAASYRLNHSNISETGGNGIPEQSLGFIIPDGTGEHTFFAANPADILEHTYAKGIVSAGTFDIKTKVLFKT